jgi:hypothetical protein
MPKPRSQNGRRRNHESLQAHPLAPRSSRALALAPKDPMTLTLLIQKEVTAKERDKIIRQLEKDGWCVNVEDEGEDEE